MLRNSAAVASRIITAVMAGIYSSCAFSCAAATSVFAVSENGVTRILQDPSCARSECVWIDIDNDPRTIALAASSDSLFQLRSNGWIWKWRGGACVDGACANWTRLDHNSQTIAIAANDNDLFQLHRTGAIWRWTGGACDESFCGSWVRIDNNPRTRAIVAADTRLFQLHDNGAIWQWGGEPCVGVRCSSWRQISAPASVDEIAFASRGNVYRRHRDGTIWQWNGRYCDSGDCPSWSMIDNNRRTRKILAAPGNLFQVHDNGRIWKWQGRRCDGASCPYWDLLDNNPRTRMIGAGAQPYVSDFSAEEPGPAPLYQVHNDGAVWRWEGERCTPRGCLSWTPVSAGDAFSGFSPDRGGLFVFDTAFPIERPPATRLFGYADLHTHPASFLGFGGREDGRLGMMWGRPAVGDGFRGRSAEARFDACYPEDHWGGAGDLSISGAVSHELRKLIISTADGRTAALHTPYGNAHTPSFENWPNSLVVSHQQIDVEWLRRAHQGGLRSIVAAAVDNEIVDTAYDWSIPDVLGLVNAFFNGDNIRRALGMPRPGFALQSARDQLEFIRRMVEENDEPSENGFMEIARSGADARRIVASGKMAIILGVELDTLTTDEIRTLVEEEDVRFVTPIHFVDNETGGAAGYEFMFTLLNGIVGVNGQPYDLIDDVDLDFRVGREFGSAGAQIDDLTSSALGWRPIGEACAANATVAGRRGCVGKRNARGLTAEGRDLIRWLLSRGVMVDLAHMSEASQAAALVIAEEKQCPVMNSHTGIRGDEFERGATEREIPENLARRLLDLGGVIGVGTGVGEYGDPRRIYYNAGNPLIDLRRDHVEWLLDLRQPELQQAPDGRRFISYRVTVRVGSDNIEAPNTLTATLLSRSGELGSCNLTAGRSGAPGHTTFSQDCRLPSLEFIRVFDGVRLEHTAANCGVCTPDNISIDSVRVEAILGSGEPLTLIQRTGGHEGEVARLQAPSAPASDRYAWHRWESRLLPRRSDIPGRITGLRVNTFTTVDDLAGPDALGPSSAPAAVLAGLKHHRARPESAGGGALRLQFGSSGFGAGAYSGDQTLRFPSRNEGLEPIDNRSSALSFENIILTTGREASNDLLNQVVDLRRAAEAGAIDSARVSSLIAAMGPPLIATGSAAAGWAIADPVTAGVLALAVLLAIESHDNWSTYVSIDLVSENAAGEEITTPFLVNYNPQQRITRARPASQLFRGLPERIDAEREYGGIVVSYNLTRQNNDEKIDGDDLEFEIEFSDGARKSRFAAPNYDVKIGQEYKTFIPFDGLKRGNELTAFRVRAHGGATILISNIDIGLVKDPVETFVETFRRFEAITGDHNGQLAFGSDLSGFEALIPFSAIDVGMEDDPTSEDPCATGMVACPEGMSGPSIPPRPGMESVVRIDVEEAAGRPDPARAIPSARTPAFLQTAQVGGPSSRFLVFSETGLSTVGQFPEFVIAASRIDRLRRGAAGDAGPQLFNSVDGLVRAWERLDRAAASGAPPEAALCED